MSQSVNPTITGLQNMVANDPRLAGATNPSTQWASYDTMLPVERAQLLGKIQEAKRFNRNFDPDGQWVHVLTPEFYAAIEQEVADERAAKAQIAAEKIESDRIRVNAEWDRRELVGSRWVNEQPTDNWGATIGTRAYKWLRNFKSYNGNWYAEYQPVRGGDNRKYFSISYNKWQDDYMTRVICSQGHSFRTMTPINDQFVHTNCPSCGDANITYRGRY